MQHWIQHLKNKSTKKRTLFCGYWIGLIHIERECLNLPDKLLLLPFTAFAFEPALRLALVSILPESSACRFFRECVVVGVAKIDGDVMSPNVISFALGLSSTTVAPVSFCFDGDAIVSSADISERIQREKIC